MRRLPFLAALPLLALLGCYRPPRLYFHPVQGPRAGQALALPARTTGLAYGEIRVQLPEDETCVGAWSEIPVGQTEEGLASAWDEVYGTGFYRAQVLGSPWRGRATLTGSHGTIFHLELHREAVAGARLRGVARDNRQNLYKIVQ